MSETVESHTTDEVVVEMAEHDAVSKSVTFVYYHGADLDGHCSGAVAMAGLRGQTVAPLAIDYGYEESYIRDLVTPDNGDKVVFVDFTPRKEDILWLVETIGEENVTIIDHHETALKSLEDMGMSHLPGMRVIGEAGCELAWKHFFPGRPVPAVVTMLGAFDVWDHFNEHVVPFEYGMELLETRPSDPATHGMWSAVLRETTLPSLPENPDEWTDLDHILNMGMVAKAAVDKRIHRITRSKGYPVKWEGKLWYVVNAPLAFTTDFEFEGFDPGLYDGVVWFAFDGAKNRWKYSLRSFNTEETNVGKIASGFAGGGGHAGAASFTVFTPIPELLVKFEGEPQEEQVES